MLDADSFQTAESILRMVRIMQIEPKLGILQSLVVGMPSTSAFARVFQFGMRLGMRSYTLGSAWWQGECGPYWGHNAIIRIAPFMAHCHLPPRPDGSYNLSHDQLEALLMRRAGYEVRVLPEEGASWEENPPTLLEFIRRDLRWAQGNMQYWPYLWLPGVQLISRYQIAFAMLMFVGSPAWIGLLVLGTLALAAAGTPSQFIRPDAGMALFAIILTMWFAPKIATVIDVVSRPALRRAFGGATRFVASVVTETLFFLMLSPIMWFGHTMFLTGLVLGRKIGWGGQARDDHSVPWSRCGAAALAAYAARLELHSRPRLHGAGRHSVCAVHRGRAGAVDPARRHHVMARGRPRADAARPRRPAGGKRAARSAAQARAPRHRGGGAARLTCWTHSERCAGCFARCASITAGGTIATPWTGSMPAS